MAKGSSQPQYRRILLKISGEALQGDNAFGIDPAVVSRIADEIAQVQKLNVQVAIVIGGGNLFRGAKLEQAGMDRITADYMGMLATVMNAMAMRDLLEQKGIPTAAMSAIPINSVINPINRRQAIEYLEQNHVVIFSGGTGNPLVTTDTTASLRGIEIGADVILKATNVDGVYSADPRSDASATLYKKLTYAEALEKELGVMDLAAFVQCRDHNMALRVFNINKAGALLRIIQGEDEGTVVTNS